MGAMTPTVRANVKAWECDIMAHMNVQHYLARSAETVGQLQALLGLPPGTGLRHRAERVLFMRELRNGDSFTIDTGILALARNGLTTFNEMRNIDTGAIAARFIIEFAYTERANGRELELPAAVRDAAQALTIDTPADLRPREPLPQPPVRAASRSRCWTRRRRWTRSPPGPASAACSSAARNPACRTRRSPSATRSSPIRSIPASPR